MKHVFPISARPLEYIAHISVELPTKEGPVYMYIAYDPFLDKLFNLSIEKENTPENVLKSIYYLSEDPLFAELNKNGFTLVLGSHHELENRIENILCHMNGVCAFNKPFHDHLSRPILKNLSHFMKRKHS